MNYFKLSMWIGLALFALSQPARAETVGFKTNSPRETMRTFMSAMQEYREGKESRNLTKQARIQEAMATLNLSGLPQFMRETQGRTAAILLKEVIDRVIVIDYRKIPSEKEVKEKGISRWRLKSSEIVIAKVETGPQKGQFLFAPETVSRVGEFYEKLKNRKFKKGSGLGALYEESWIETVIPAWSERTIVLIPTWKWLALVLMLVLGFLIKWISESFFHAFKKMTSKTKYKWDDAVIDALEPPAGLIAACLFWYLSILGLQLSGTFQVLVFILLEIVTSYAVIWAFYRMTTVVTVYLKGITAKTDELLDDQVVPLVARTLRIFVVIFGILIVLQNLGLNVASVLAGLGIGGFAIALAGKDLVANLFGFITIIFDRPFRIGDWVMIKSSEGTVEEIGFRSTRIRTFYNSVISVPNALITNEEVDNMGSRKMRRTKTVLGLKYDTSPQKIEAFIEGIKKIIQSNQFTYKESYHVVMQGYGSSALEILLYCFLVVPDWTTELKEKQNIYLEILRLSKEIGVEFAFPTTTLHVESLPSKGITQI